MKSRTQTALLVVAAAIVIVGVSVGGGIVGGLASARGTGHGMPTTAPLAPLGLVSDGGLDAANTTLAVLPGTASSADVARAFQERFRAVAAATLPVVVEINVVNTVTQPAVSGSPLDFFFGNPQGNGQLRQFQQEGLGSGVLVSRRGDTVYVLTNNHVVGDADQITVVLYDKRSFAAKLVGKDELSDLALVSFETGEEVPLATLGDSESLAVGDWVFAVGNPLGFEATVTAGIVSAKGRDADPESGMSGITDFIQTDAAINQGNSGGALVNLDGEVVGISSWIASQTGGSIGLGFAVPVNIAKKAISDFITSGQVMYSWLGVQAGSQTEEVGKELGLDGRQGAFVFNIYEGSPAASAGIQPGDLIIKVGTTTVTNSTELVRAVASLTPGDSTTFTVIRDARQIEIGVKTAQRNAETGSDTSALWPGVSVATLTSDIRRQLSVASGVAGVVVAAVSPEGAAAASGLTPGDVITGVNNATVASAGDFYRQLAKATGNEISFRLVRNGRQLTLGFERPRGR